MKISVLLIIGYVSSLLVSPALAQTIEWSKRIGGSINQMDPNEPSVCINPMNANEIMIGTNTNHYYYSEDGGNTWQHGVLRSSYGVSCDPAIICDDQDNFYYFHLVPDLSRVVCQKKAVNTPTWSDGSYTALNGTMHIDKEWAAFDPVNENLYVTWTQFNYHGSTNPRDSTIIFLSRSEDRGITWSDKIRISQRGGNASGGFQSVHGSYPATGPDGEVYVSWWSPAGLMFDKSTDQGKTWLPADRHITDPVQWIYQVPGMILTPSFPVIGCDRSNGRYRGAIYINWSDNRSGANDSNIWIAKSMDGGKTWSNPIRVNDDPGGKHQYFNSMTIDQVTGYVYIAFYDRRNYTDNRTDVYLAVSKNGGSSFENMKISETPFIPYSTVFFGHYLGVSANDNKVITAWSRMDNGINSLWGAMVNFGSSGQESPIRGLDLLEQNNPNPFNEYTFFSFKLKDPGLVTLRVRDMLGHPVATLIDHQLMNSGKHIIRFMPEEFDLAPGMYYYTLISKDQTVSKKMIYSK